MRYMTREHRPHARGSARQRAEDRQPRHAATVREHADGVWNPIYLVAGRLIVQPTADGDIESEAAFVHTAEGSTRLVTCQEGLGLDRDLPLSFAGNTLDLVRRARAYVAERLAVSPSASDVHHAVKVATLPAHIIIGVLGPDGLPSTTAFPEVISEFVQSIHEEPRPWNAIAQGGVRGERLVLDLADGGLLTESRRSTSSGATNTTRSACSQRDRGATIACNEPSRCETIVRNAILEDPSRQQLTGKRYAQTVGPLLLAIYRQIPGRQKNVVAALTQEFQPPALEGTGWASARTSRCVTSWTKHWRTWRRVRALVGRSGRAVRPVAWGARELGARLLRSGQPGQRRSLAARYRRQDLSKLMVCPGGLKILCEAAERAEDGSKLMPHLYQADGEAVLDADGNPLHLHPDQGANVHLRELAFRERRPDKEDEEELASGLRLTDSSTLRSVRARSPDSSRNLSRICSRSVILMAKRSSKSTALIARSWGSFRPG